jgi:hypothetical protein
MTEPAAHPVFLAIEPLLVSVGGEVIAADAVQPGDLPIHWEGEVIGGVRLGSLTDALDRMVAHVEAELGGNLSSLSRTDKQSAVRMLDDQGAFLLRKSIDHVAERMGVTRITIYNYLTLIRDA